MADEPTTTFRGILQRNTVDEPTSYRLNNVTIEVDLSSVEGLNGSLEGQPVDVEGRFETREHPESGTQWVFKARSVSSPSASDRGSSSSTPPRGGS